MNLSINIQIHKYMHQTFIHFIGGIYACMCLTDYDLIGSTIGTSTGGQKYKYVLKI